MDWKELMKRTNESKLLLEGERVSKNNTFDIWICYCTATVKSHLLTAVIQNSVVLALWGISQNFLKRAAEDNHFDMLIQCYLGIVRSHILMTVIRNGDLWRTGCLCVTFCFTSERESNCLLLAKSSILPVF